MVAAFFYRMVRNAVVRLRRKVREPAGPPAAKPDTVPSEEGKKHTSLVYYGPFV
jgi:hypothetical protein